MGGGDGWGCRGWGGELRKLYLDDNIKTTKKPKGKRFNIYFIKIIKAISKYKSFKNNMYSTLPLKKVNFNHEYISLRTGHWCGSRSTEVYGNLYIA